MGAPDAMNASRMLRPARGLAIEPAQRARVEALYADYAAALDDGRYADWIELFVDDCRYRLQPRENFDRGLPLATLSFEGKGMLRDRIYGIEQTLFHAPYYQRHVIGPMRIVGAAPADDKGAMRVRVEANYAVYRTRLHERSQTFNVGRYLDEVVDDGAVTRFADKLAVFDSEMIPNSIIYPI
jgi:salicylate 5-hydroxylase small subunit